MKRVTDEQKQELLNLIDALKVSRWRMQQLLSMGILSRVLRGDPSVADISGLKRTLPLAQVISKDVLEVEIDRTWGLAWCGGDTILEDREKEELQSGIYQFRIVPVFTPKERQRYKTYNEEGFLQRAEQKRGRSFGNRTAQALDRIKNIIPHSWLNPEGERTIYFPGTITEQWSSGRPHRTILSLLGRFGRWENLYTVWNIDICFDAWLLQAVNFEPAK